MNNWGKKGFTGFYLKLCFDELVKTVNLDLKKKYDIKNCVVLEDIPEIKESARVGGFIVLEETNALIDHIIIQSNEIININDYTEAEAWLIQDCKEKTFLDRYRGPQCNGKNEEYIGGFPPLRVSFSLKIIFVQNA